ncbi:MAG TPA: hypothetical protein VK969_03250 [Acidimicrobiia bacterium]|nr:hypothetical protein [Acidimicrobiia bacterium]
MYLPVEQTATASAEEDVRAALGTEALKMAIAQSEHMDPTALIEMADPS